MKKIIFFLLLILVLSSGVVMALVQPMGIAKGSYKLKSEGEFYVAAYCMDYAMAIPQAATTFTNVLTELNKAVVLYNNTQIPLQQAIDDGIITINGGDRNFDRIYNLYNSGQVEWLSSDEIDYLENTWPTLSDEEKESAKSALANRSDYRSLRFVNNTDEEVEIKFLENTVLGDRKNNFDYYNSADIAPAADYQELNNNQNVIWQKSEAVKVEKTVEDYNSIKDMDTYITTNKRFKLFNKMTTSYSLTGEIDKVIHYLEDLRQRLINLYGKDYQGPSIEDLCYEFYKLSYYGCSPEMKVMENNWPYIILGKDRLQFQNYMFYINTFGYIPSEIDDWYNKKIDGVKTSGGGTPPPPVPIFVKIPDEILKALELASLFNEEKENYDDIENTGVVLENQYGKVYFIYHEEEVYQLFETQQLDNVIYLDDYGVSDDKIIPRVHNNRWYNYKWDEDKGKYIDTGALFLPFIFE